MRKYLKYSFILLFILTSALRGNVYASVCPAAATQSDDILKSELLSEAKGLISNAPEISNGGAFQQNIFKLKNSFGNSTSFSAKLKVTTALILRIRITYSETAKIPLYIFYRSIII